MEELEAGLGVPPARLKPASDVSWLLPGQHGSPAEAVARIEAICTGIDDLFCALFAVLATHQSLPRDILARAVKQLRDDLAEVSLDDVSALLTSILNGGRPGFEAVLRSRKKGDRKSVSLPWAAKD